MSGEARALYCDLMSVNGLRGECARQECIYWACLGESDSESPGCALTHFGLVGVRPDPLAKWLLQLMISNGTPRSLLTGC